MTDALTVLSRAALPAAGEPEPPQLPGFVGSPFSPLVAAAADRCLRPVHGEPPLDRASGERTALVLASVAGDLTAARAIAHTVDTGQRMSPLLFLQSVETAVLGHVGAAWGIAGPVVCVSPVGDAGADALALAADLIRDGDADTVLVLVVELVPPATDHYRATATLVAGPGPDQKGSQP
jgi:3-oxoacyl-(acyl-carrier-protein) synthase